VTNGIEPLRLLSDDPIQDQERDGLELCSWAQVVASAALHTEGPLTIGVFGRWGVGKTSVLHLAKGMIDRSDQAGRREVTSVMFNAWQYEEEPVPLVPLIASILQELEERAGKRNEPAGRLGKALRSALYGLSAEVKGKVPLLGEASVTLDADKSIQRFETLSAQWVDQQIEKSLYFNAFRSLREVQRSGDPRKKHRVVVFVDDLDRCLPDKAMRLLESIKLVLSEPRIIFVLAVDRRVLEGYLDKRFRQEFGLSDYQRGPSYLAKFIQLSLWIPPHESRFQSFINRTLKEELADAYEDLVPMCEEIGVACGHNPRQLVRFLNDLLVDRFVFRKAHPREEFPFRSFVAARGVRLLSEGVYYGLLQDEELRHMIRKCRDDEDVRKVVTDELLKVRESEPLRADVLVRIQSSEYLPRLLASEPARQWLEGREAANVDEFLSTERQADEARKWNQAVTERALEQINSTDRETIVAGCQTLAYIESPLRLRAVPRLFQLTKSEDERVAQEARRTLEEICSPGTAEPKSA
jgi:hypothetical protein